MAFKRLFALFFGLVATVCWADADNALIGFSSNGPDCYADGTVVRDGEWYALCWSANDSFGGLTAELKPMVEGDRVLLMAPLAKDGKCPYTVFQVDSADKPSGGKYFVLLLDTRNPAGAVSSADENGKPKFVNAESRAVEVANNGARVTGSSSELSAWVETDVSKFSGEVKIVAINAIGQQVKITVSGMQSNLRYSMITGATVGELTETPVTVESRSGADHGENVEFIINKGDARLFRIVRQSIK